MKRQIAGPAVVLLLVAVAGCGSNSESPRTEAEKEQALRDSAFGAMPESLDRARAVEQQQMDRMNALNDALEDAEGH